MAEYHLDTHLNPPSVARPNIAFFAFEKLTPGLNFQLEDKWAACSGDRISLAMRYAECRINPHEIATTCQDRLFVEEPPLACMPRRTQFPAPNINNWPLVWRMREWPGVSRIFSFFEVPPKEVTTEPIELKPPDCLAKDDLTSCFEPEITKASPTARALVKIAYWVFWDFGERFENLINGYYKNGFTRYTGWVFMVFGWSLVGVMTASLAGVLRRED